GSGGQGLGLPITPPSANGVTLPSAGLVAVNRFSAGPPTSWPSGLIAAFSAISAKLRAISPSNDLKDFPSSSAPRNAVLIERATPSARSPMRSSSSDTSLSSPRKRSEKKSSPIGKQQHQTNQFSPP